MNRNNALTHLNALVETQSIEEMIFEMNKVFLTKQTPIDSISFDGKVEELTEQYLNVLDEIEELQEAIADNDYNEIKDAFGDILTFGYGALYILGLKKEELPKTYRYKLDIDSTVPLVDSTNELFELFKEENTIGNIVEALRFVEVWANELELDLLYLLKGVTKSNYTKLMFDNQEVDETMSRYTDLGVKSLYVKSNTMTLDNTEITYHVIFSGADQVDNKNKAYRKDKFLKSVHFVEPIEFL